ncbi:hypothetical protein BDY21DRAFT_346149 [Lineolata rhizophorae]|uniref:F-box domain-containing protein n=1 Tax=Lineolata rhizophorae TaxID=578093 RepID=A0A6A6NYL3_9PEZI|nr:hypothetical protein BDY21DRAFT_346149 [Lineolata rhizophorae]
MSLDRLNFDVLYHVASYLDLSSVFNLGLTCKQLYSLLDESTLCRRTMEKHAPFSKEATLARLGKVTYQVALRNIYARRHAFASAIPYFAKVIGRGSSICYRDSVLCFLSGQIIHAHHLLAGVVTGFDITRVLADVGLVEDVSQSTLKFNLLNYNDGVLAVHIKGKPQVGGQGGLILAIKVDQPRGEERPKVLKAIRIESSSKLFVRHTETCLIYGTHSGMGEHGHHEWEIRTVLLEGELVEDEEPRPIQLDDFVGSDIGSTSAFDIHDGYFYALSNLTSFDVQEVDWTSFYHCIRFPIGQPQRACVEKNKQIYRRQHAEGPINDAWTELSLQVDEATNEFVIVEARREWLNGESTQHRSFYMTKIWFGPQEPLMLPPDDILVRVVGSDADAHYAPTQPRHMWQVHREVLKSDTRTFIFSRTKLRAYNLSATTFLDLVEDSNCCPLSPGYCFRIRVGARRLAPWEPSLKGKEKATERFGEFTGLRSEFVPIEAGPDNRLTTEPIRMWPPISSALKLSEEKAKSHDAMNPHLGQGGRYNSSVEVVGTTDERNVVFLARPKGGDDGEGSIVLISFDPAYRQVREAGN